MKNVLVLLHDDAGQEARLQAGLDLTRALGGHLNCLEVCEPAPPMAVAPYGMIEFDAMMLEQARTREDANRADIQQRLDREDVSWSIANMTGDIASCIADQAGLADLVVLNRRLDDLVAPDMVGVVSRLVLHVRKPVVAVPEKHLGFAAAGPAVVAWDSSAPAMTALTALVPLLALASSVTLVEITKLPNTTAEEAAAYLSRHDISAEVVLIRSDTFHHKAVVEQLQSACLDRKASYCIMGAYGHSRVREAVFGGVTRAMLTSSPIPLVIAH